jgi:hypothetical protein
MASLLIGWEVLRATPVPAYRGSAWVATSLPPWSDSVTVKGVFLSDPEPLREQLDGDRGLATLQDPCEVASGAGIDLVADPPDERQLYFPPGDN